MSSKAKHVFEKLAISNDLVRRAGARAKAAVTATENIRAKIEKALPFSENTKKMYVDLFNLRNKYARQTSNFRDEFVERTTKPKAVQHPIQEKVPIEVARELGASYRGSTTRTDGGKVEKHIRTERD